MEGEAYMNVSSKIWQKLRNKSYREAFVAAQLKTGIPFQISAMRKKLGWSQEKLAEMARVTQGVISRAENPNYGNLTFNTVLRIAAGFDAAFVGWFVPFSKLAERFENLTEESVQVPTFEEEDKALALDADLRTSVISFTAPQSEPHPKRAVTTQSPTPPNPFVIMWPSVIRDFTVGQRENTLIDELKQPKRPATMSEPSFWGLGL